MSNDVNVYIVYGYYFAIGGALQMTADWFIAVIFANGR